MGWWINHFINNHYIKNEVFHLQWKTLFICTVNIRLTKQLNLKGEETNLSIIKVGNIKENVALYIYELPIKDQYEETVIFPTYYIDKVSTNLKPIQLSGVMQLFEGINDTELQRTEGEVNY